MKSKTRRSHRDSVIGGHQYKHTKNMKFDSVIFASAEMTLHVWLHITRRNCQQDKALLNVSE